MDNKFSDSFVPHAGHPVPGHCLTGPHDRSVGGVGKDPVETLSRLDGCTLDLSGPDVYRQCTPGQVYEL